MIRLNAANLAQTTLASALSSSETSMSVSSSSGFPQPPFRVTLDDGTNNEIVEVTAVNGTTWTIVRAREGTTARSWSAGTRVELRWTAGMYDEIKNSVNLVDSTSVSLTDGSFQVTNLLGVYGSFSSDFNGDGVPDGWTRSGDSETTINTVNGMVYIRFTNSSISGSRGVYRPMTVTNGNRFFVRAWRNAGLVSGTYNGDHAGIYISNMSPNVVYFSPGFGTAIAYLSCTATSSNISLWLRCLGYVNPGTYTVEAYYDNAMLIDVTSLGELPANLKSYFNNLTYWADLATSNNITNAYGTTKTGNTWLHELIPYGEGTYTVYYRLLPDRIVSHVVDNPVTVGRYVNTFLDIDGSALNLRGSVTLPELRTLVYCSNANVDMSLLNESIVFVNASSGARTVTLPLAEDRVGKVVIIKKIDSSSNAVTIAAQSGNTIEGQSQITLTTQYQTVRLIAYSSTWYQF